MDQPDEQAARARLRGSWNTLRLAGQPMMMPSGYRAPMTTSFPARAAGAQSAPLRARGRNHNPSHVRVGNRGCPPSPRNPARTAPPRPSFFAARDELDAAFQPALSRMAARRAHRSRRGLESSTRQTVVSGPGEERLDKREELRLSLYEGSTTRVRINQSSCQRSKRAFERAGLQPG